MADIVVPNAGNTAVTVLTPMAGCDLLVEAVVDLPEGATGVIRELPTIDEVTAATEATRAIGKTPRV